MKVEISGDGHSIAVESEFPDFRESVRAADGVTMIPGVGIGVVIGGAEAICLNKDEARALASALLQIAA